MNISNTILTQLQDMLANHQAAPQIDAETYMDELQLDSVAFTGLLAKLEAEIGFIPTEMLQGLTFPETVGELIAMYESEAA